jgi:enoyl-CoA hydratase/carnithine racemase
MESVIFERSDNLGIVTFANPPLNLVTFDLFERLEAMLDEVSLSPIRALLVRGGGAHFCAGANVGMFKGRSAQDARQKFSRALPRVINRLEELPFPTLAEVQGLCLAAGLEMAMACDLIIAGRSAQFAQVEVHIGTSTLLGGIERLVMLCGAARAREIVFSGDRYSAEHFERWGIINRVVDDAALAEAALAWGHKLANGPTSAHACSKRLVRAALDSGVRAADQLIPDIAAPLFETHDMQHGVDILLKHGSRDMLGKAVYTGK